MPNSPDSSQELIYDWNSIGPIEKPLKQVIEFDDETLRDGLQSPSVTDPKIEDKIKILHLMDGLGIQIADIGLAGAGPNAYESVYRLAKEIRDAKLNIRADSAARTVISDIDPIIEISQKVGIPIEVSTFIGSSPIRQYVEEWDLDSMLKRTEVAVEYVVKHNLPVMYVTEDTARANPDTIKKLYTTAIECGAKRICVCDTVGHSTPEGVKNLISYIREIVVQTGEEVKIDWHGHCDRGLATINSISAIIAGADRIHGTALGIGERAGNTPMDILLVNLKLLGWIKQDLTKIPEYCKKVANACEIKIPNNYPIIGEDAFRTATGVHASAVIKAEKKGDYGLANRIYSGVPADMVGLKQKIEIGHMSGESNVIYWLKQKGIEPHDKRVKHILKHAKMANKVLTEQEILNRYCSEE